MLSKTSWKQLHANPTDIIIGTCKGGSRIRVNEYLTIKNVITYISNISKVENLISVEAYHKMIDKNTVDILGDIYVRNNTVKKVAETIFWRGQSSGGGGTREVNIQWQTGSPYSTTYYDEAVSKKPVAFERFRFRCSGFEIQACCQAMKPSHVEYRYVKKDGTYSSWTVCKKIPRSPHYDSWHGFKGIYVKVANIFEDYSQTEVEIRMSNTSCIAKTYEVYALSYTKVKSSDACDVLYTIITEKK